MPLSQDQARQLLDNCSNVQECLLILLFRDLENKSIPFETIRAADIDRATGVLKLAMGQDSSSRPRLRPDTLAAVNEILQNRKDTQPFLFVTEDGHPLTSNEIVQLAVQIGAQASLQFDSDSMTFRSLPREPRRVVSKGASRDLFYLYGIVSHPLRRQIVELLGDQGPLGFTQIRQRLDVPVGTLYYHFDMLSALVKQDAQKRYFLTSAGLDAYSKLHSPEYVQSGEALSDVTASGLTSVEKGVRLLVPGVLLRSLQKRTRPSVIMAATVLAVGSFAAYFAGLETFVLFLNLSDQVTPVLGLEFITNWLIVYGIADLTATYLFSRKGEHVPLLLGTAYALLPLLLFIGWWQLAVTFSLTLFGLSTFALSRIILIVLQAWTLGMLARIISVVKGLRLDKAAVISLTIAYLSITLALLRGA